MFDPLIKRFAYWTTVFVTLEAFGYYGCCVSRVFPENNKFYFQLIWSLRIRVFMVDQDAMKVRTLEEQEKATIR